MVGRNSNVPFLSLIRVGKSLTLKLPNSLYGTLSNCHYISLVNLFRNSFNIQRLASFIFFMLALLRIISTFAKLTTRHGRHDAFQGAHVQNLWL